MNREKNGLSRRKGLNPGGGKENEGQLVIQNVIECNKVNSKNENDRKLKSDVQHSFLQYANQLETINEETTRRKRKSGNRKKQMPSVSAIPSYRGRDRLRSHELDRGKRSNKKKLEKKVWGINKVQKQIKSYIGTEIQ